MKTKINAFIVILFAIPAYSYSAPIDPLSISQASGCHSSYVNDCSINWESQLYTPDFAAIQIERSTGSSWLIRYNLHAPSTYTMETEFNGQDVLEVTPLSGNIWLEAPSELTSTNNFNIFSTGTDNNSIIYYVLFLGMTTTDAINGSASYHMAGESDDPVSGNLILNEFYTSKGYSLEHSLDITLNINNLYHQSGEIFIESLFLDRQRNPLLIVNEYEPYNNPSGTSYSTEYYVSSVPLPAAFWLFISGLIGLISFSKSRKS